MAERRQKDGVYDFAVELRTTLAQIRQSERIDAATKETIWRFIDHVGAQGAGDGRKEVQNMRGTKLTKAAPGFRSSVGGP